MIVIGHRPLGKQLEGLTTFISTKVVYDIVTIVNQPEVDPNDDEAKENNDEELKG